MAAIGCYKSQFTEGREPVFPTPLDDIRDRARYWGWTIDTPYAEPFACRDFARMGIPGQRLNDC